MTFNKDPITEQRISNINSSIGNLAAAITRIEARLNMKCEPSDKKGLWKPEYSELYKHVDTVGDVKLSRWKNDETDDFRLSQGNVFKTEVEARWHASHLKVVGKLRLAADGFVPEEDDYFWVFHRCNKGLDKGKIECSYTPYSTIGGIQFASEKALQGALDSLGSDAKYLFKSMEK